MANENAFSDAPVTDTGNIIVPPQVDFSQPQSYVAPNGFGGSGTPVLNPADVNNINALPPLVDAPVPAAYVPEIAPFNINVPMAPAAPQTDISGIQQALVPQLPPFQKPVQEVPAAPATPKAGPGPLAELENINKAQKANNVAAAAAAKSKASYDADMFRYEADHAKEYYDKEILQQAKRKEEVDKKSADMEQVSKDFRDFLAGPGSKVDPNRMWASAGAGQQILGGIALALGALGAGGSMAGKNSAVEVITAAIDKDIEVQKANIQTQYLGKKEVFEQGKDLYANMLNRFKNEDVAEAATRLLRAQQAQYMMNSRGATYAGEQAQFGMKNANLLFDKEIATQKLTFQQAVQHQQMLERLGQDPNTASLSKEERERYVPEYGIAPNQKDAEEFQKVRTNLEPGISGGQTILKMMNDFNRVTDFEQKRKIQTEMIALIGSLRVPFTGPGILSPTEYDRLQNTIGNPTSLFTRTNWERAALKETIKKLERDLSNSAKQNGLTKKFSATKTPVKTLGEAD